MKAGENFNLQNKESILQINSPKRYVSGPYVVVHVETGKRWAIVAMDWREEPCLAIRWFHGTGGQPFSRQSTWLVIPNQLNKAILDSLSINPTYRKHLDNFLLGVETGKQLEKEYKK